MRNFARGRRYSSRVCSRGTVASISRVRGTTFVKNVSAMGGRRWKTSRMATATRRPAGGVPGTQSLRTWSRRRSPRTWWKDDARSSRRRPRPWRSGTERSPCEWRLRRTGRSEDWRRVFGISPRESAPWRPLRAMGTISVEPMVRDLKNTEIMRWWSDSRATTGACATTAAKSQRQPWRRETSFFFCVRYTVCERRPASSSSASSRTCETVSRMASSSSSSGGSSSSVYVSAARYPTCVSKGRAASATFLVNTRWSVMGARRSRTGTSR